MHRSSTDRLIFVARQPPFPLANGARIRTHRLLTGLAERFETTLVTYGEPTYSGESPSAAELQRRLGGIPTVVLPRPVPRKRVEQAKSLFSSPSWLFGRYRTPRLEATLREHAGAGGVPIVHFDDLGVAAGGPVPGAINVYSSHNVEQRIAAAALEHSTGLRHRFEALEAGKVAREENAAWRSMDLCLAVSEVDAAAMRAGGARVAVCPNGADPVPEVSRPRLAPDEPMRLLFVGSVDYQPNHRGLVWFLEEVLPLVRGAQAVEVDVVGEARRALPDVPGVVRHGRVPDVRPYYEAAHAAIVPVLFGSGTRLKVLEAMALGRPVVSTTIGVEGLPVTSGREYRGADRAEDFARAVIEVAQDCRDGSVDTMLERARAAVEPLMWPGIVATLAGRYSALLEEHRGARRVAATA